MSSRYMYIINLASQMYVHKMDLQCLWHWQIDMLTDYWSVASATDQSYCIMDIIKAERKTHIDVIVGFRSRASV